MSLNMKVQIATLKGIHHLLLVAGDLEVLLDEHEVDRDEIEIRDLWLSPWADDVIQHGLRAIAQPDTEIDQENFVETTLVVANIGGHKVVATDVNHLEIARDDIDTQLDFFTKKFNVPVSCYDSLARGIKTLSNCKPWAHDIMAIAMKVLTRTIGDASAGMDYGVATVVAFKTTMVIGQRVRDIMAIALIGKACELSLVVTSWHDPEDKSLDRYFETLVEADRVIAIESQHLHVITAMDYLVQTYFVAGESPWPGIEI